MILQGNIINITRFCTDDGPGIRTTVFLKGCPLRCAWCHNPESQNADVETYVNGETIGRTVTAEEVVREVLKDKAFYETSGCGVTISGGEPLFQPEFTAEVLRRCKEKGIHTAIETSGFAREDALNTVLRYCDLVLFDIKETDKARHIKFTGVPLDPIIKNLKQIDESKIPFMIRLPVSPGVNDREENFLEVKALLCDMRCCQAVEIMPYHKLGEYKYQQLGREYLCQHISEPTKEQVKNWKNLFEYG